MDKEKQPKECFSCKVISVCCLCGIGGYLISNARTQNKTTKIVLGLLGAGSICLGIGEMFNKSPFRSYEN